MQFILLLIMGLLVWTGPSWAQGERRAMTRDTLLQWVAQHKDAQPNFQPSDTLTFDDIEKLRPFIPPGYFEEFQFPEVTFEITPTGDYAPRKDYLEATEKYASQTRLAQDGSLEGYVAGQPFPTDQLDPSDPTSGLKIGWNFNFRWQHYGPKVGTFATIMLKPGGTHGALPGFRRISFNPVARSSAFCCNATSACITATSPCSQSRTTHFRFLGLNNLSGKTSLNSPTRMKCAACEIGRAHV